MAPEALRGAAGFDDVEIGGVGENGNQSLVLSMAKHFELNWISRTIHETSIKILVNTALASLVGYDRGDRLAKAHALEINVDAEIRPSHHAPSEQMCFRFCFSPV